ncbi:PEP-CTERM sorting domain-containing protein [Rugamonas rivuli]|uniref:Ice-binding protein C-terminal domain-containing protein n=1 Tax=Rugamonas rivuli TaxID=2743358 RepID=A0A843SAR3_9BURK|nr:PEP-CTERM sorting domain-containing protein [Rugamonas rivuli]MQA20012.1 hypothetical protein [Rugamonas rivuli]
MKSKILAIFAASLICSTAAQAADQTWTFSFTGFYNDATQSFDNTYSIGGAFTGSDRNADGTIDGGEISSFIVDGVDYANCSNPGIPYFHCGLSAFSYAHGALNFGTTMSSSDPEGIVSRGQEITSGVQEYRYMNAPSGWSDNTMHWTADTRFDLTSPVPEADTYAMLLAGFATLGVLARRRRNAA